MGSGGTLAIGSVVAGRYRIVRSMAVGGMGEVYEAVHGELSMRVALKVLQREQAAIPEAVERFMREARAAASLGSEHVAKVFDVGRTDDGAPYLAMELLEGYDLEQLVERRGALPVHEAVGYVVEALDALIEAHARGIVHRDLKPSNLFVARSGERTKVKILDFGISKLERGLEAPNVNLTTTRSMLGSPGYMSPEQVRSSKNVDARTDLWSLGVILYELLIGAQAFQGETLGDVFAKIREEPLAPIRSIRSDVPAGLEAVLMRCLERDRSLRHSSALELSEALKPFTTSSGVANALGSPPYGVEQARASFTGRESPISARLALTAQTRTDWSTRFPQTRGATRPLALVLGLSVLLGAGLGYGLYRRAQPTGPTGVAAAPLDLGGPARAPTDRATAPPSAPVPVPVPVPASAVAVTSASAQPSSQPSSQAGARAGSTAAKGATQPAKSAEPAASSGATAPKPPAYDPNDLGI